MNFPQFLEKQFLEWQQKEGRRRTAGEFAKWLGFAPSTVSTWWSKHSTPNDQKIIEQLANKLGMEVYDVLGLDRPDADLYSIQQNWEHLTPAERRAIREQTEQLSVKNETKRAPAKRRTSTP